MENLIIVDNNDKPIGQDEKLATHQKGRLHRSFSIFIFNSKNELMLQKRASGKYHSGGLWTNTCCSHPRVSEDTEKAAHRRLQEEMGFDCGLEEKFSFQFKVKFENGLIENEFDHVFVGRYDDEPKLNPEEAEDWKWVNLDKLEEDIKNNPDEYSYWLKVVIEKYKDKL